MSRALVFNTRVDEYVRKSGVSRRQFAEEALISPSSLLKARAADPDRGKIHWTTLALIGMRMGVIGWHESVSPDDKRLRAIARGLVSTRGRGAPRYDQVSHTRHLRVVA